MDDLPLSHASLSEACARVAYRLIERRFARMSARGYDDLAVLRSLVRGLDKHGWRVMSFWVSAYAYSAAQGELPEFTRTAFIMRSRMGMAFRDVAFVDYKAARRRDPRVTNRGVRGRASAKERD